MPQSKKRGQQVGISPSLPPSLDASCSPLRLRSSISLELSSNPIFCFGNLPTPWLLVVNLALPFIPTSLRRDSPWEVCCPVVAFYLQSKHYLFRYGGSFHFDRSGLGAEWQFATKNSTV